MMLQQQGGGGGIGSSGDSVAAAEGREHGGLNEEEKGRSEESERNSGGSRWPRQETIALLKIRADMDVAFRDSSLKGPLWDEVSRKLSELGYHRSAKKCKEKFENVYKYHKRTKDGRNTKADGKTYRFFEQLEALDHTHPSLSLMSWSQMKQQNASHPITSTMLGNNVDITSPVVTNVTVSSTPSPISTVFPSNAIHPINLSSINISSQPSVTISPSNIPTKNPTGIISTDHDLAPAYNHNPNMSFLSNSTSSTSSDEQPERYGKRKRKWEDFFGRLMSEVIQKQDELQKKFLDALDKRERDRIAREEAWRVQEIAKMNREHERLLQERSMAAAKDAAVISFLQKITEQQHHQHNSPNNHPMAVPQLLNQMQAQTQPPAVVAPSPVVLQVSQPEPPAAAAVVTPPAQAHTQTPTQVTKRDDMINQQSTNYNGGVDNAMVMSPSPSRWPKAEIQALINFRTTLDTKYHETGPKGPLWEEISAAMRKIGYNRNAKRCKEKWENINKYYKKVKESNKKRPEDAKTCPYFHQLEALYKEKAKTDQVVSTSNIDNASALNSNPLAAVPIMAQPEQQWPLQEKHKNIEQENDNLDDPNMNDDDYENDDDEDEDDGGAYEIVPNKQQQQQTTGE